MSSENMQVEVIHDEKGLRVVRLSQTYSEYNGALQTIAELGIGLVTLSHMHSKNAPRSFSFAPADMTRLAHSWLAFMAEQDEKEHMAEDEYRSRVTRIQERARMLYAEVEEHEDGLFSLLYENSPLWHTYSRFRQNEYIGLDDIETRLDAATTQKQAAQTETCQPGNDDKERWQKRAQILRVDYHWSATGLYALYCADTMFDGFWTQEEQLTAGQVEYRLRYMEGVMSREV